ncbi:DNA-protecting protein DprA [Acinetobacter baumannii]|uniref:DNA-processing protein DprA n=1 Tax=Acinetobacter baumannii TaxID=470 RepID=UPI001FF6606B|nr:DNA-processing protein DprA [Acinetobacter baumannii]MCJ9253881.1 DNA-protecting protein DprA [Acinetobacter baumannii]
MHEEDIGIPPHHIFLGLIKLNGVGFQTLYKFFEDGKSLSDLLRSESPEEFMNFLGRTIEIKLTSELNWNAFLNDLVNRGRSYYEELRERNISFILYTDYQFPEFPPKMKMPVFWLFVEGNLENLYIKNALTLVGSRGSSEIGFFLANTLLFGIGDVKESIVTISGLAAGIDQIVHELSLLMNIPTIAVLGNGLNENYPASSKKLKEDILQAGGTIITEYFPDMKPSKEAFVNRNRIQAALSKTVIPLEWKEKSGTAHTIRFASEMGKQICFVETPTCRKFFTEHALANSSAQRKYGGNIFILPNAINSLLETLGLTLQGSVIIEPTSPNLSHEKKSIDTNQPKQIGWDF